MMRRRRMRRRRNMTMPREMSNMIAESMDVKKHFSSTFGNQDQGAGWVAGFQIAGCVVFFGQVVDFK